MTIIGIPLGIITLILYGIAVYLSTSVTALIFGHLLHARSFAKKGAGTIFVLSVGIFLLLHVLTWIPVIGWLVNLVALLMGVGAVTLEIVSPKKGRKA